jgi:catechol 1,2-dioxygenase
MDSVSRRDFVTGLATLGVGAALVLRADARPTVVSGTVREYRRLLKAIESPLPGLAGPDRKMPAAPAKLVPTEKNILGPYYRPGAPFRAKITPPLEPGTVTLISGRVWASDTKKPLAGARLDIWQANAKGRYDNDDPDHPPKKDFFLYRARLIADETGYYEFEKVHPGRYKIGPDAGRPSHIHYAVVASGYQMLVTQLYFKGDPYNAKDEFIHNSLIIEPKTVKVTAGGYESGTFDVVLKPAGRR